MPRENILERYHRGADGKIVVEVASDRVEDIYNNFDKSAPYYKKDLEEDVVDYLIDCVRDLGREPFTIRFRFLFPVDDAVRARVKTSIENYFQYLKEIEMREVKKMMRSSAILFLIGIFVLAASVWLGKVVGIGASFSGELLAEGLTIVAWISLWESIATLIINWPPKKRQLEVYGRIARAEVRFE